MRCEHGVPVSISPVSSRTLCGSSRLTRCPQVWGSGGTTGMTWVPTERGHRIRAGASPRPTSLSGSLLACGAALSCPGGRTGSGPCLRQGPRAAEGLRGVSRPGRSSPGLPAVGLLGQRRSGGPELEGETDPLCCPLAASRGCRLALSPGGRRGSGWSRPLLLPIGASWESLRHPRNLAPFCVRDKARTHDNEVL